MDQAQVKHRLVFADTELVARYCPKTLDAKTEAHAIFISSECGIS